ncbi:UbiA family prenyltransferase [Patescibacteria group bacterium]|nr:UbiA family prenyltransferase [Patescibacteria group bacterium]
MSAEPSLLYVDLDGTLLTTDSLWETLVLVIRQKPSALARALFALRYGKAAFKRVLATAVTLDVERLPYHPDVLAFIQEEQKRGTRVILATGADMLTARAVAAYLKLDDVLASDGFINQIGEKKRSLIEAHAQGKPFAYIGNERIDQFIWSVAARAHVVASLSQAKQLIPDATKRGQIFPLYKRTWRDLPRLLRMKQWVKNLLVILPLFLAHQITNAAAWTNGLGAALAMSFIASAVYVINDLLDIHADRRHPIKRERLFAAGKWPLVSAIYFAAVCLCIGFGLTFLLHSTILAQLLLGYLGISSLYTFILKRFAIIDVLTLALLYVFRLYLGTIVMQITISNWLLSFAFFFFTGLAFLKRFAELPHTTGVQGENGRGYNIRDADLLRVAGLGCGLVSLLVFALYLQGPEAIYLYHSPSVLWGCVVIILAWMLRVWLLAGRGEMIDDPIVFALTDRWTHGAILLTGLVLLIATNL